jgi:hypothetical protein
MIIMPSGALAIDLAFANESARSRFGFAPPDAG